MGSNVLLANNNVPSARAANATDLTMLVWPNNRPPNGSPESTPQIRTDLSSEPPANNHVPSAQSANATVLTVPVRPGDVRWNSVDPAVDHCGCLVRGLAVDPRGKWIQHASRVVHHERR